MNITHSGFRLLAFTVVAVLALTLVAPARADALEPLVMVAIASLAVVGVIIIVYLIVANMADSRGTATSELRYVACVESDAEPRACWALPEPPPPAPAADIHQG